MLTQLTVKDWKSFDRATLYIDTLTVLVGTNASGKSNLLDAVTFLSRVANGASFMAAVEGDSVLASLRGGVEWAARKPEIRFAIGATVRLSEEVDFEYEVACFSAKGHCDLSSEKLERVQYRIDRSGGREKEVERIRLFWTEPLPQNSPIFNVKLHKGKGIPRLANPLGTVLFQLASYANRDEIQQGIETVIAGLKNIFILDPIPSHMRGFVPLSDRLALDGGNIAGVIAALPPPQKEAIERTLTDYVSRLPEQGIARVYAETVGKFNTDAMLYCDERFRHGGAPMTVDARPMSDGTLRFLAILTALLTRPPNSLLVVEEVDNGLHPSRSRLLLEALRTLGTERHVDVVATTHNPALLDAMGTDMVPYITVAHRDPATGASRLTLLEDIGQLPKLLAQGPVGRLSSQGLIEQALKASPNEAA